MTKKLNILIVYNCSVPKLRPTTWNHLYFWKKYSGHNCFFLNIAINRVSRVIWKIPLDIVVFDTLFMSNRWDRDAFFQSMEKVMPLKQLNVPFIAFPQDEFINTDILCDFINEMGISIVFSAIPKSQYPLVYNTVNYDKVKFHTVLTGYIDDNLLSMIRNSTKNAKRYIDIGYRTAGKPYAWFGKHGYLKQIIADKFIKHTHNRNIYVDISTENKDTILGTDWFRFLARCKYTIGTEGGTSLIDRDGSIHEKTSLYVEKYPDASFQQIERKCFPGHDGTAQIFALSPRHLEACMTRTCQILTQGDYNGVLKPGRHFIEIKKDLSNIEEVLNIVEKDDLRNQIVENAYLDIVASGKYSYRSFCKTIINKVIT